MRATDAEAFGSSAPLSLLTSLLPPIKIAIGVGGYETHATRFVAPTSIMIVLHNVATEVSIALFASWDWWSKMWWLRNATRFVAPYKGSPPPYNYTGMGGNPLYNILFSTYYTYTELLGESDPPLYIFSSFCFGGCCQKFRKQYWNLAHLAHLAAISENRFSKETKCWPRWTAKCC